MSEAVVVGRLRVRAGGSVDPLLLRLRAAHLLDTADLTPPGLPPGAILTIRRLADPLPGRLTLDTPQLAPDRAWQAALTGRLAGLAARAERPLRQAVGASAEAVLFADQGELLACLALDWLAGQLLNRWWWREVVRNRQLGAAVVEAWLGAVDAAPAALGHLNTRGEAVAFLRKLDDGDVARLLTGLVERHRLSALGEVVAASVRGATGTPAFTSALSEPQPRPLERQAGPDGEDATLRTGASGASADRPAEVRRTAAPWQRLVPTESADLSQPRQMLLGIGLELVHAPQAVRGEAYARQALRWYEGRPAETVETPAMPPAARTPMEHEKVPDPASQRAARPPDEQVDGAARRDAEQMTPTSETASGETGDEGQRPDAARSDRAEPAEAHGAAGEAGAAGAAEEAQAPGAAKVAAEAVQAGVTAVEDGALDVIEVRTAYAGLFYLVNVALGIGFYADFTQPGAEGELALSPWGFLALIGRELAGEGVQADPVWPLLGRLAGVEGADAPWADRLAAEFVPPNGLSVPEWVERTASEVFAWVAARFPERPTDYTALADIAFVRAGRVRASAGRLDVTLRLDDLHIAVRLAALDRNPGWVPAAGRTITFYYE